MALAIGVDIGGTKVAGGRRRRGRDTWSRASVADTPPLDPGRHRVDARRGDPRAGEPGRTRSSRWASARPASSTRTRSSVRFAPNLAWREEPLRAAGRGAHRLPVVVENDGNTAAWAEFRFGAGRGESDVIVVDRRHRHRRRHWCWAARCTAAGAGMAGEWGHLRLVPEGRPCGCGRRGCWEQYASGNALVREARERAAALPEAAAGLLAYGDGTPEGMTGPMITAAAQRGRPAGPRPASRRSGRWLGRGHGRGGRASSTPGWSSSAAASPRPASCCWRPARAEFADAVVGRGSPAACAVRGGRRSATTPAWSAPPTSRGCAGAERDPLGSRRTPARRLPWCGAAYGTP